MLQLPLNFIHQISSNSGESNQALSTPGSSYLKKINSHERSYCTHCNRKFYKEDLIKVYYKLLHKEAFHCQKCMSGNADNLQHILREKEAYLLELFSGSGTVSTIAGELGFRTCSVDIEAKYNPTITADIAKLSIKEIPGSDRIFIIWASLPCQFYSILNSKAHWKRLRVAHRKYSYAPSSVSACKAIQLLEKTLLIIRKVNPIYFFIENPRGVLRHMPQMKAIPFMHTVSYNDFGLNIYKPTDIFHNCPFLKLKKLTTSVGKKFPSSVAGMNNSFDRAIVPADLAKSIIEQITKHHNLL